MKQLIQISVVLGVMAGLTGCAALRGKHEQAVGSGGYPSDPMSPFVKPLCRPADAKEFEGHYYKFIPGRYTWQQAKLRCEQLGGAGYLVCINSREENDFVHELTGGKAAWLGATDEGHERRWKWVSGEPFSYRRWKRGEPTNSLGREHWLAMASDGLWNDVTYHNGTIEGFVCEWDR
jgi:hypothetical protein